MILPRPLSVMPSLKNCCVEANHLCLRAPYINYNRCLPGSWIDEMLLRLSQSKKDRRVLEQVSALINSAIYREELLADLVK